MLLTLFTLSVNHRSVIRFLPGPLQNACVLDVCCVFLHWIPQSILHIWQLVAKRPSVTSESSKTYQKKLFSKKILCLLCSETSFIFPPCWTSYLSLRSGFADRCLKPLLKLAEFAFSSHGYSLACSVISVSQHFWSHQKMEIHLPESIINLPDFSCPSDCLKPVSL